MNFIQIAVTESRLELNQIPKVNINLPDYLIEHTPSLSEKSVVFLHISTALNYKERKDWKLYKNIELESVFIEVIWWQEI